MDNILKRVNLDFSLDDIKKIIKLLLLNNSQIMNGYDAMSKVVADDGNIQNYDEFIVLFFKAYIERLNSIGLENIKDKKLKKDYIIIKNSELLQNPSNASELLSNKEFQELNYKPISLQGNFTHIHGSCINNFISEDIECRFYLSPKMENITELITRLIVEHNNEALPCYFKFSKDSKRNDRIILYSSLEKAEMHLQILESIKKENPKLFAESNKNPLWGNINGISDIYFGVEPYYKGVYSYGSIRGTILDLSLDSFKEIYGELDSEVEITDDMASKFKEILDFNCIINGINQNNLALNKNISYAEDTNEPKILLDMENGKKLPIYVSRGDFEKRTIIISWPYGGKHGIELEIPIEELDLLYKRDKSDALYDESEFVRNKIALEFKKLAKKEHISEVLQNFNLKEKIRQKRMVQRNFLDGKVFVGDGSINYTAYMLLPVKISNLIVKLQIQKENIKKRFVDPEVTEEISEINSQISDFGSDDIERAVEIVQQMDLEKLDPNEIIPDRIISSNDDFSMRK